MPLFFPGTPNTPLLLEPRQNSYPPTATLTDDFATSIDSSLWISSGSPSISGGVLDVPGTTMYPSYDGVVSAGLYALRESYVFTEVPRVASGGTADDTALNIAAGSTLYNAGNWLRIQVEAGTLYAQALVASVPTTITSLAYDATNHRWWRIIEAAGTVSFDVSADGTSWSSLGTTSTAGLGFSIDAVEVGLFAGWYTTSAPTTSARFDNLNTLSTPVVTTNHFLSLSGAGS